MTGRPGRDARRAGRTDGGPGLAPRRLCRGEGTPGGAASGLADDAGSGQLPEQAEGRLRRDRQVLRQAARGDNRGAQHVIERPGEVRAGGTGEAGPSRFGPLQAGQFLARGACCGGDAGEEAGLPFGADPQGETVMELDRRGPKGQGGVLPETGVPPVSYCLSDCTERRGNPPVLPWRRTPDFALSAAWCEEFCLWRRTMWTAAGGIERRPCGVAGWRGGGPAGIVAGQGRNPAHAILRGYRVCRGHGEPPCRALVIGGPLRPWCSLSLIHI